MSADIKQRLRKAGVVLFIGGGAVILVAFSAGSLIADGISRLIGWP